MTRTPVDALTARRLGLASGWDRSALDAAQFAALRQTVRHAMDRGPWFREHLAGFVAGFDPDILRVPADLSRLPFMTAADVAAHGPRMVCVSQSEVARIITLQTSGSTGAPKRLHFIRQDLDGTIDFFLHGMMSLISGADRVLALLPFIQPDSTGDLLIRALAGGGIRCDGCWPPTDWEALATRIGEDGVTCVVGLPQHLLALAHALPLRRVRTMLLCSDYAPSALRARIERACGCETFLHYGTTETGLGGGVECAVHDGCHLRESDLLVEIVDPLSGQPVPHGEEGEVVVTTLGRRAMPLIRYRTGDVARLTTQTCACGGVTARLRGVQGRRIVCRLAGGGALTSQALDEVLFALDGLLDYRATVDAADDGERLGIEFLARPGHDQLERDIAQAVKRIPAVVAGLGHGFFLGPMRRVSAFSPSHTVKRTIADLRGSTP